MDHSRRISHNHHRSSFDQELAKSVFSQLIKAANGDITTGSVNSMQMLDFAERAGSKLSAFALLIQHQCPECCVKFQAAS